MAGTTTRKPAAPRRGAATKTVAVQKPVLSAADSTEMVEIPDDGVIRLTSVVNPDDNPFDEREPVFWIDDKEYTAPIVVPASWGLEYLSLKLTIGIDFAVVWAMQQALGTDVVQELCKIPTLTPEQLAGITNKITDKFIKATQVPKGKLRSV